MFWIVTFGMVVTLWLDLLALGRVCPDEGRRSRWMVVLAIIDSLPIAVSQLFYLFSTDNPTIINQAGSWATFLFVVIGAARIPLNIAIICSRRLWGRMVGFLCSAAIAAIALHGMVVTRTDYIVNEVSITSARLPKSFDGMRVVQFSDLHIGTLLKPQKEIAEIVEICNALKPDIVAFTGDLADIRHSELTPPISGILSQLEATEGVYSITGNHDIGVYIRDSIALTPHENTRRLIAAEQQMGWRVLNDETAYILRGKDSIAITGLSFKQSMQEQRHSSRLTNDDLQSIYADTPEELFNITLSHVPQIWESILAAHNADLTLAGHVHAMQIAPTIGKWRISPSMLFYKRWSGLYEEQGRSLYINDGIGYGLYPMRIGARPEITLFVLHSHSATEQ